MNSPYIGITGFMAREEVEKCLECVPQGHPRKFMVGVLASSKTIAGESNTLWNKFARREDFARICTPDPRVFNCIHFATREPEKLYDHLMMCREYGGENLHGIQLNIAYPNFEAIRKFRLKNPDFKLIFQLSPHLPEYRDLSKKKQVIDLIQLFFRHYGNWADYVLLDFSRGFGRELDLLETVKCLGALSALAPMLNLSIGGGLDGFNVGQLVRPLLHHFPELSWDAEGKLRDESEGGGYLNPRAAEYYLAKSFAIPAKS